MAKLSHPGTPKKNLHTIPPKCWENFAGGNFDNILPAFHCFKIVWGPKKKTTTVFLHKSWTEILLPKLVAYTGVDPVKNDSFAGYTWRGKFSPEN